MFTVLLLAGVEKIVNLAIASDPITQSNLQALNGKTLRIAMNEPDLKVDVLFNDKRIRIEPVIRQVAIFEPKMSDLPQESIVPDATIFAKNLADLFYQFNQNSLSKNFDKEQSADAKFLADIEHLLANFDPDIIGKLQSIIGLPLASQLTGFIDLLKQNQHQRQSMYQPAKTAEQESPEQRLIRLQDQLAQLQQQIADEQEKLAKTHC